MNFLKHYINNNASAEINKVLLWDFGREDFDYRKNKKIIIQRVVEYGSIDDWSAIFSRYSEQEIIDVIKGLTSLSDLNLNFVCKVFHLDKNDLRCCTKAQWRKEHWI